MTIPVVIGGDRGGPLAEPQLEPAILDVRTLLEQSSVLVDTGGACPEDAHTFDLDELFFETQPPSLHDALLQDLSLAHGGTASPERPSLGGPGPGILQSEGH